MAMLHIENIDISENTDFFNDISKNDIWYISPALVFSLTSVVTEFSSINTGMVIIRTTTQV